MFFLLLNLWLGLSQPALATQYEVIPLDPISEKALKNSSLSTHVVSLDHSQKEFHKKTLRAYKKMSSFMNFKSLDVLDFVYDSRFLNESAFFKKYSDLSKRQLIQARKVASEVYSK